MPFTFDKNAALQAGYTPDQINSYVQSDPDLAQTVQASPIHTLYAQAQTGQLQPHQQSALESFLRSKALTTIGAVVGGLAATPLDLVSGPIGNAIGAGVGGAAGEAGRRGLLRMMGQNPDDPNASASQGIGNDVTETAKEGALSGLFDLGGGLALKGVGAAAGKAADLLNLNPENLMRGTIKLAPKQMQQADALAGGQPGDFMRQLLEEGIWGNPTQMIAKAQQKIDTHMGIVDDALAKASQNGVTVPVQGIQDSLDKVMGKLKFPDSNEMIPGTQAMGKEITDFMDKTKEIYGDSLTPTQADQLRGKLNGIVNHYQGQGPLDTSAIQQDIAQGVNENLRRAVPEIGPSNDLVTNLISAQKGFAAADQPKNVFGDTFAGFIRTGIMSGVGLHAFGPLGALGGVFAQQALKDPAVATRLATLAYNIGSLGESAPAPLKILYNMIQPTLVQTAGHVGESLMPNSSASAATPGASSAGTPPGVQGTADQSAQLSPLASKVLLAPNPAMDHIQGNEFTPAQDYTNPDGSFNLPKMGITKLQMAQAILSDPNPKMLPIYKEIYSLMADPTENMNAADKKSYEEILKFQNIVNTSKEYMSVLGGQGPLMGNLRLATVGLKQDPNLTAYEAFRKANEPALVPLITGLNRVNMPELQGVSQLLPTVADTKESAAAKYRLMDQMLNDRMKAFQGQRTSVVGAGDPTTPDNTAPVDTSTTGSDTGY